MLQFLPNHLCPSFVPSFPSFPCLSLHVPCSPAPFSFHLPSSPVLFASLLLFAPVCARFRSRAHGRSKLKMFGSISDFGAFRGFFSRESQPESAKQQKTKMQIKSCSSNALAESLPNLSTLFSRVPQIRVQRFIPQEWGSKYGFLTV